MKPQQYGGNDDAQQGPTNAASWPQNGGVQHGQNNDHTAHIVRQQLNHIYGDSNHTQAMQQQAGSPYDRTHEQNALQQTEHNNALKQYHTAWQNYYKEYYQRYYLQQVQALQQKTQHTDNSTQSQPLGHGHHHHHNDSPIYSDKAARQSTNQIHEEIVGKIKGRARQWQGSSHFMPIVSAIVVGLLFMSVQYNRLFVAQVKAYVSPGSTSAQNIIIDPTTNTKVSQEPRLIVPKINVDAPVVYGVESLQENTIQAALRSGIVHYPIPGANSLPGQAGNSVFLGHSSNDVFDTGQYKFVFVLLERLEKGDTFYAHYKGTRYTYSVTKKEIIDPSEVSKLVLDTDKPMATLVTCVPPGTALKRLVVYGEQISPDPAGAAAAGVEAKEPDSSDPLPGYAPTLFERLFGGDGS